MTAIVRVIGPSDSGKTTLVEQLVERLATDYRVATVKSIHHDVEVDTPGKDTYEHRAAGAETVVGVTPTLTFRITTRGKDDVPTEADRLAEVVDDLATEEYDVILIEGFTDGPYPAIVLGDDSLVDDTTIAAAPAVGALDIDDLVDRILQERG